MNFIKNPLCTIEEFYVGEGKTLYCDMFGQIISIHRTSDSAIYISEVCVNTINAGEACSIVGKQGPVVRRLDSAIQQITIFSSFLKQLVNRSNPN